MKVPCNKFKPITLLEQLEKHFTHHEILLQPPALSYSVVWVGDGT